MVVLFFLSGAFSILLHASCVSYYEMCVNTIDEYIENTEAEGFMSEDDGNEKSPRNDGWTLMKCSWGSSYS